MVANEYLSTDVLRHGAYLCLRPRDRSSSALARVPIQALADRFGFRNEFTPPDPAAASIAFLRRRASRPGDIEDDGVLHAAYVLHVAAKSGDAVATLCREAQTLLEPHASVRLVGGVVRPKNYTGGAMERWAYERALTQKHGEVMPNGFLIPMSKTARWWEKGWMERHTYFLPRYDDQGRMLSEGHALASGEGILHIVRRTYQAIAQPAPSGAYDFVTYFECSDAAIPIFERVCAALRDIDRNPEWTFVHEGPTWHGRRVPTWHALFQIRS